MRLSFPLRIPVKKTIASVGVLVAIQQAEHTSLAFSMLFALFVILSVVTFNLAGGFSRASGAYVFFFSLLAVIFGVFCKVFVSEPADSNLEAPLVTMAADACGMLMMLLAVFFSRKLTSGAPGVGSMVGSDRLDLRFCGLGCIIVGVVIAMANFFSHQTFGGVLSAINQINFLLPLGVILVTVDVVQKSDGSFSVHAISIAGMAIGFVLGIIGFSKQGMFTPFAAWVIGAMYAGLRLRWVHVVSAVVFIALALTVLTPVSQVGKDVEASSLATRAQVAFELIRNLGATRDQYETNLNVELPADARKGYYNARLGLVERLTMISGDDALIAYTDRTVPLGYEPIRQDFGNWLPHFLSPNKVMTYGGNYYAHEIGGVLAADDFTTGISFGPIAEAFHIGRWYGIFFLAPAIWFLLFTSTDLVCGDLRRSPWGLMAVLAFGHLAPEGGIGSPIYFMWYENIGIVATIFFCVFLAPVLGLLFGGSNRNLPGNVQVQAAPAQQGLA